MKVTLHFRDEAGWPTMTVDRPVAEHGDRVRIINYAQERFRELEALCRSQREITKAEKARGTLRHPVTFFKLWVKALTAEP